MTGNLLRWLLSLAHGASARNGEGARARLTILRHHRVYADHERPLYRLGVSESVFTAQLGLLGRLGLTPLTVTEGLDRLERGEPGHWVALSFDDGYADNVWRALPRLHAASARATFYLTAGLIEDQRAPWWDELAHALEQTREPRLKGEVGGVAVDLPLRSRAQRLAALERLLETMRVPPSEREQRLLALRMRLGVGRPAPCELASWEAATALVGAGMEVGAHTLSHPHLTTLGPGAQAGEIEGSVELIEHRLGVRPVGFAYPAGDYGPASVACVEGCGLAHAVTTRAGDNGPGVPRYELRRRGLSEGACLGPSGRFSERLARAELDGAFDRLRARAGAES